VNEFGISVHKTLRKYFRNFEKLGASDRSAIWP